MGKSDEFLLVDQLSQKMVAPSTTPGDWKTVSGAIDGRLQLQTNDVSMRSDQNSDVKSIKLTKLAPVNGVVCGGVSTAKQVTGSPSVVDSEIKSSKVDKSPANSNHDGDDDEGGGRNIGAKISPSFEKAQSKHRVITWNKCLFFLVISAGRASGADEIKGTLCPLDVKYVDYGGTTNLTLSGNETFQLVLLLNDIQKFTLIANLYIKPDRCTLTVGKINKCGLKVLCVSNKMMIIESNSSVIESLTEIHIFGNRGVIKGKFDVAEFETRCTKHSTTGTEHFELRLLPNDGPCSFFITDTQPAMDELGLTTQQPMTFSPPAVVAFILLVIGMLVVVFWLA